MDVKTKAAWIGVLGVVGAALITFVSTRFSHRDQGTQPIVINNSINNSQATAGKSTNGSNNVQSTSQNDTAKNKAVHGSGDSTQKDSRINIVGTWRGNFTKKESLLGLTDAKKLEYRIKKAPDDYGNATILVKGWYGDDYTIDYATYRNEVINGVRTGFLTWDDNYGITNIRVTYDIMTGTIKPHDEGNPRVDLHLKKIN